MTSTLDRATDVDKEEVTENAIMMRTYITKSYRRSYSI